MEPIDPNNPNGPNPGTAGPLSIDFASSLSFGKNRITNKDMTYFGKAKEVEIEGEMLQKNEAITMFLPGSTPKEAVEYQTDLTWTLASIPKGY